MDAAYWVRFEEDGEPQCKAEVLAGLVASFGAFALPLGLEEAAHGVETKNADMIARQDRIDKQIGAVARAIAGGAPGLNVAFDKIKGELEEAVKRYLMYTEDATMIRRLISAVGKIVAN
jgi:hypothetical protein